MKLAGLLLAIHVGWTGAGLVLRCENVSHAAVGLPVYSQVALEKRLHHDALRADSARPKAGSRLHVPPVLPFSWCHGLRPD